jgi:hypothetical protein
MLDASLTAHNGTGSEFTGSSQDPHSHGGSDPAPLLDLAEATRHCQTIGMELAQTHLRAIHWDSANMKVGGALDLPPGDKRRRDLEDLQRRGYRLYLIAGGGKEDKHVQSLSHCWAEWDGLEQQEVLGLLAELGAAGLPDPTLVLNTWKRGSIHVWWQLEQACTDVQRWRQLMGQLVLCLGSDRNCVNPSRLMRLAGSAYWGKAGKPHAGEHRGQARILEAETTEATCTLEELEQFTTSWMAAHPDLGAFVAAAGATSADPPTEKERAEFHASRGHQLPPVRPLEHITALLDAIPKRESGLPDGNYWKYPRHRLIACGLRDALYRLYRQGCTDDPDRDAAEHAEKDAIELMEQRSPSKECSWRVGQVVRSSAWLDEGNFWKVARHLDGFNLPPMEMPLEPITASDLQQQPSTVPADVAGVEAILAAVGTGWVVRKDGQRRRQMLERGDLSAALTARLAGRIGFDELALMPAVDDTTLRAAEVDLMHVRLSENGWKIAKGDAIDGLLLAAQRNRFHPVRRYLERLEADTSITPVSLGSFGADYYGTTEPLHGRFMRLMLLGAVWRAMEPGCDFKTCVVLQSGRQTLFKSRSLEALAGADWFCDSSQENEKDLFLAIHTCWFYELAEIETQTGKKAAGKLKNQLSSKCDTFRPPYGKGMEKMPRSSIFAGSCNRNDFLVDETGNTRFLVVPITQKIDYRKIERDRDRIWKAAVAAYRAGERPWLTEVELEASERQNEGFTAEHEWTQPVADWLAKNPVKAAEGFSSVDALLGSGVREGVDAIQPNRDANQMARVLRALGFEQAKGQRRVEGKLVRLWRGSVTGVTGVTGTCDGTCDGSDASAGDGSNAPVTGVTALSREQDRKGAGVAGVASHVSGEVSGNTPVTPAPTAPDTLRRSGSQVSQVVSQVPVTGPRFQPGDRVAVCQPDGREPAGIVHEVPSAAGGTYRVRLLPDGPVRSIKENDLSTWSF